MDIEAFDLHRGNDLRAMTPGCRNDQVNADGLSGVGKQGNANAVKGRKGKKKKILSALLLAAVMLCAACGKDPVDTDTDRERDTAQISADETDTKATEALPKETDADPAGEFLEQFADIERQSEELKDAIDHGELSQTEYNSKSYDLYTLWDDALNDLWKVLGKVLSKEDMDRLTAEEQAWIADKDQKVTDAGKEAEGGSMQPMLENLTGAELTEKRVRELLPYIQDPSDAVSVGGASETSGEQGTQNDLFSDFLNNGGSARVADHFTHDNRQIEKVCQAGDVFDLAALKDYLQQDEFLSGVEPEVEYAYLDNPNRKAYALQFCYQTSIEGFTQFFILSENNGQLEINFAIDGWSRRYSTFNEYGVIFDSGSNGAGSHEQTVYVPDMNFEYKVLSDTMENGYGYSFYDPNGEPVQAVNDIMEEAADGDPDAMSVLYSQVTVDGTIYYYYLGYDGITQEMVDYIDGIAARHGFTFDGKDTADAAVLAYAKKLGVEEIYDNQQMAEWRQ